MKLKNNGIDLNDFFPTYKWFGTAPFCMPNKYDLAEEGYVPVEKDKCGDGHCCVTGQKILGMKPVIPAQTEELKINQEE